MEKRMPSTDALLNSEEHAELINNSVIIENKTTPEHNNAVIELAAALKHHILSNNGSCKVFTENVALYCDELCSDQGNLFLPDVMTVCDKNGIKADGVHSVPLFVAEVTSLSTRRIDYGRKAAVYGEIGVNEYWVVDLQRKCIVQYLAKNDFAPVIFSYPNCTELEIQSYPSLKINLRMIFE